MHNNVMQRGYFVSDMLFDGASMEDFGALCDKQTLLFDIEKRSIFIKTVEQSRKFRVERGKYVTYDINISALENGKCRSYLATNISKTLCEMLVGVNRVKPLVIVGLGNKYILADSLGDKCVSQISCGESKGHSFKRVCAFSSGVFGTTGIESIDFVSGVCDKVHPSAVILIDALATSSAKRLGCSFQISTAGISPGSGVGQDKKRIDQSVLGVPTISIGVPMMLSLQTCIYAFLLDYLKEENVAINEYLLREKLSDFSLSRLIVGAKDIDRSITLCSSVISDAINKLSY